MPAGQPGHNWPLGEDDLLRALKGGAWELMLCRPSFGDGSFSYSGLSNHNGVVFGSPTKDLRNPVNLFFPANDRIHFTFLGNFR